MKTALLLFFKFGYDCIRGRGESTPYMGHFASDMPFYKIFNIVLLSYVSA